MTIKRLKDQHYALLGIAVGVVTAFLTTAWTTNSPSFSALSILVAIALTAMLAGWLVSFRTTALLLNQSKYTALENMRLQRRLEAKAAEFADFKHHMEVSDLAFRALALQRTEFDNDLFVRAYSGPEARGKEMADQLAKYLEQCCDAAVNIFAARKMMSRDSFHCNIKVFKKEGGAFSYRTIGRSPNTQESRRHRDDTSYEVESNYVICKCREDADRQHIVEDVDATISHYLSIQRKKDFAYPTLQASHFYKSSLTRLLFIKSRTALLLDGERVSQHVMRNSHDDWIYGCISIDSDIYKFSRKNKEDVGIIEEISINALSAVLLHDRMNELVNNITV